MLWILRHFAQDYKSERDRRQLRQNRNDTCNDDVELIKCIMAVPFEFPSTGNTMDAVVFIEPYKVEVQRRPVPEIEQDTDAIVKIELSGLCGSDLHPYRGKEPTDEGTIMGHEFVGTVVATGVLSE